MTRPEMDPRRLAVTEEARRWLGRPYHHMGWIKGAGTDCLMMLAKVYEACGVIPHLEIPFYPADGSLHRDAERYLDGVMRHAIEISGPPQPGDVAVFRFGRCYAHGAIVVEWPRIIHAGVAVGVIYGDATQPKLASRKPRFFDPFVNIFVEPKWPQKKPRHSRSEPLRFWWRLYHCRLSLPRARLLGTRSARANRKRS